MIRTIGITGLLFATSTSLHAAILKSVTYESFSYAAQTLSPESPGQTQTTPQINPDKSNPLKSCTTDDANTKTNSSTTIDTPSNDVSAPPTQGS